MNYSHTAATDKQPPAIPRQSVLVVTHGDGFVEVFAEPHSDVRIIEQPSMASVVGERLAEEYVGLSLPRRYRDLYCPRNRRAVGVIEGVTPAELARREDQQNFCHALDRMESILCGEDEGRIWML